MPGANPPWKNLSKYDAFKVEMEEIAYHLEHITPYTIKYYQQLKEKYSAGKERKTELRNFDVIEATSVVAANQKLYVNRKEGFVGTSLKKDEFVSECSDIDDIIVFLRDGKYSITKVATKTFVGKDILYVGIFKRNDSRTIYNVIYQDGKHGSTMIKRFAVTGVTRDKEYDVTKGTPGSRILYFTANPNGEAEIVKVTLKPKKRLRNLNVEADFSEISVKGRSSQGNIVTRNDVYRVALKESGVSTLGGRHIWFDPDVARLNADNRGLYLGEFFGDDQVVALTRSGLFSVHSFDLSTYFEPDVLLVEKYDPETVYSAVFYDGEQQFYYLKRFTIEATEKLTSFIGDHSESRLMTLSADTYPRVKITYGGKRKKGEEEVIEAADFIAVKSFKARGKRLTTSEVASITQMEPLRKEEPGEMPGKTAGEAPEERAGEEGDMEAPPLASQPADIETGVDENKGIENKGIENKGIENKGIEKKAVEEKTSDNKKTENKEIEKKESEKKDEKKKNTGQMGDALSSDSGKAVQRSLFDLGNE